MRTIQPLSLLGLALAAILCLPQRVTAAVTINGAELTGPATAPTGLTVKDCQTLTEADYRQIRQFTSLKSLSFGSGLDDAALKLLAGLPSLETFTSNGANVTDDGIRSLAMLPNLRTLTFFHHGKNFQGTGLAALAALPNLERFSVCGSLAFADPGLTAVAGLTHLQGVRVWHTGVTITGVKALRALKELKSLTIGQRLAATPPVTLNDDTVAVLAEFTALEALTLQEARLSLTALSRLNQLPNLKRLTLDSIDIPENDIATLRKTLPKTDIKWTPPTEPAQRRITSLFGPR